MMMTAGGTLDSDKKPVVVDEETARQRPKRPSTQNKRSKGQIAATQRRPLWIKRRRAHG
jgi:hypothetical protein